MAIHAALMKRSGFLRNKFLAVLTRVTFSTFGIGGSVSPQILFGMAKKASFGVFFKLLIMTSFAAIVGCILQVKDFFVRCSCVTRSATLGLRLPIRPVVTNGAITDGFPMGFMIK